MYVRRHPYYIQYLPQEGLFCLEKGHDSSVGMETSNRLLDWCEVPSNCRKCSLSALKPDAIWGLDNCVLFLRYKIRVQETCLSDDPISTSDCMTSNVWMNTEWYVGRQVEWSGHGIILKCFGRNAKIRKHFQSQQSVFWPTERSHPEALPEVNWPKRGVGHLLASSA